MKIIKALFTLLLIAFFAAAWQNIYKQGILKAAYPERYAPIVEKYARQSNIAPELVYAVIKSESSFKPGAMSGVGAMGLMQLTPETFEWAQTLVPPAQKYTSGDLNTPEVNIRYGTILLSALLQEFHTEGTALAAYHAGRGNVHKWLADRRYSQNGRTLDHIPFANTRAYVKKVLDTEQMYKKLYDKQQGV